MLFDNHKDGYILFLIKIDYPRIILFNVYLLAVHFMILAKDWPYLPNQQDANQIFLHLD